MAHKTFYEGQHVEHKYNGDTGIIASKPDTAPNGKTFYVVFWDDRGPKEVDGEDLQTLSHRGRQDKHTIVTDRLKPDSYL